MSTKIVSAILFSVILGSMVGFGLRYAVFNSQIQSLRKDFVYTKVEIEGILSEHFVDILPNTRTVFARWSLTWLLVLESGEWAASVGNSTWGAMFDYDFGTNAIFGSYTDLVGFRATMTIPWCYHGKALRFKQSLEISVLEVDLVCGGIEGYSIVFPDPSHLNQGV